MEDLKEWPAFNVERRVIADVKSDHFLQLSALSTAKPKPLDISMAQDCVAGIRFTIRCGGIKIAALAMLNPATIEFRASLIGAPMQTIEA